MKIEKIIRVTPGFSHRIAPKTAEESQESTMVTFFCGNSPGTALEQAGNAPQLACSSLCFSVKFCVNVHEKASAFHPELHVA
jgi:hypothetical protein